MHLFIHASTKSLVTILKIYSFIPLSIYPSVYLLRPPIKFIHPNINLQIIIISINLLEDENQCKICLDGEMDNDTLFVPDCTNVLEEITQTKEVTVNCIVCFVVFVYEYIYIVLIYLSI